MGAGEGTVIPVCHVTLIWFNITPVVVSAHSSPTAVGHVRPGELSDVQGDTPQTHGGHFPLRSTRDPGKRASVSEAAALPHGLLAREGRTSASLLGASPRQRQARSGECGGREPGQRPLQFTAGEETS